MAIDAHVQQIANGPLGDQIPRRAVLHLEPPLVSDDEETTGGTAGCQRAIRFAEADGERLFAQNAPRAGLRCRHNHLAVLCMPGANADHIGLFRGQHLLVVVVGCRHVELGGKSAAGLRRNVCHGDNPRQGHALPCCAVGTGDTATADDG